MQVVCAFKMKNAKSSHVHKLVGMGMLSPFLARGHKQRSISQDGISGTASWEVWAGLQQTTTASIIQLRATSQVLT